MLLSVSTKPQQRSSTNSSVPQTLPVEQVNSRVPVETKQSIRHWQFERSCDYLFIFVTHAMRHFAGVIRKSISTPYFPRLRGDFFLFLRVLSLHNSSEGSYRDERSDPAYLHLHRSAVKKYRAITQAGDHTVRRLYERG